MDQSTHRLTIEADNGDEVLLVCPEPACGRRIVLKRAGGMVVLDRGDFYALHTASSGGLDMSAPTAA